ncbi:uncharacterized protein LOC113465186 isoform X2 [Ceratina calcarata]|uniref:Uncharacterized protein LOC113465186 isoform X2 n=1 Tax=Ceratina calcarata TaxID=156304 RepID=A0AAJ7WG26_9HYME|nr:uncharacterized protein LOC113465186 isoform X2 [Ceratina calcarata]
MTFDLCTVLAFIKVNIRVHLDKHLPEPPARLCRAFAEHSKRDEPRHRNRQRRGSTTWRGQMERRGRGREKMDRVSRKKGVGERDAERQDSRGASFLPNT